MTAYRQQVVLSVCLICFVLPSHLIGDDQGYYSGGYETIYNHAQACESSGELDAVLIQNHFVWISNLERGDAFHATCLVKGEQIDCHYLTNGTTTGQLSNGVLWGIWDNPQWKCGGELHLKKATQKVVDLDYVVVFD